MTDERAPLRTINWPVVLFTAATVLFGLGVAGAQQVLPIDRYSVLWVVVTWGGFISAAAVLGAGFWLYRRQKRLHPDLSLRVFVDRWLDTEAWSQDAEATLTGTDRAFSELRQKARLGTVAVWGRKNCLFGDTVPLSPIPQDFWDRNGLDHLNYLSGADEFRGRTEPQFVREGDVYTDIHLNLAEVEKVWPKPRRRMILRSPITFERAKGGKR